LNSLHPRKFVPSLIQFGLLVLEKIFENFQSIFTLSLSFPLDRGYLLSLNKIKSPSLKDNLCQVWLKLAQWFWRRRFLNDPTPFYISVIISPLKRTWPFI
jgi:hypothetical protein